MEQIPTHEDIQWDHYGDNHKSVGNMEIIFSLVPEKMTDGARYYKLTYSLPREFGSIHQVSDSYWSSLEFAKMRCNWLYACWQLQQVIKENKRLLNILEQFDILTGDATNAASG